MEDPTSPNEQPKLNSPARRHFLAAVSAAGARVASIAAIAAIVPHSSANAGFFSFFRPGKKPGYRPSGFGPRCFLRGTHILTDRGEVRVEDLKAGDVVRTMSGKDVPVAWIGHSVARIDDGAARTDDIVPVRIARDAIGAGVPHRDLYVSPWHFLYFNGHLLAAKDLVNGTTITRELPQGAEALDYFHILLDRHDVIVAEGVLAESLLLREADELDVVNLDEIKRLDNSAALFAMASCAPRVWYSGGRSHLVALLRLGASRYVDVRDPIQRVSQQLAARAA